ncbi:hypothetical protein A2U01_0096137, partial [Trifolium medium]|nr:hypothetical protein [Trifolium medium]
VIKTARPRLITTRRPMRKGEDIWDEEGHMTREERNPVKVEVVVVRLEVTGTVSSVGCRVTVSSSARRMKGSV